MSIVTRPASESDIAAIKVLLDEHAPNEWNYITPETTGRVLELLQNGRAVASLSIENEMIVGACLLTFGEDMPADLQNYAARDDIAYAQEVVVHREHVGKGLGSLMLEESIRQAGARGISAVYAKRHDENRVSAGMM
ncbi:MAG: GNAT family N-acetyltransferase [Pseudomonadota bacterium]